MLEWIKNVLNAQKNAKHFKLQDAVICAQTKQLLELRSKLNAEKSKPAFNEVAKDFDASKYFEATVDKVVEDLSGFYRLQFEDMIRRAAADLKNKKTHHVGRVAMQDVDVVVIRIELDRCGTVMQMMEKIDE